ncbi:hypothetical protein ABEW05_004248 [Botrytis cinerea]
MSIQTLNSPRYFSNVPNDSCKSAAWHESGYSGAKEILICFRIADRFIKHNSWNIKRSENIVREDNKFIDNEDNHACKDLSEVTFCRVKKVADSGSSLLLF